LQLQRRLGWPESKRRGVWLAASAVAVMLLCVAGWRFLHPAPLPPWDFQGEVTDRVTSMPIADAEVDILTGGAVQTSAWTDAQGRFDLHLPQPKLKTIEVRIRKDGYEGEPARKVPTDQPWNIYLTKLP
jgi:hypothetical protein